MHNHSFSEFLLSLMASATDADPVALQTRMVSMLRGLMPFDMAWWGWSSFAGGRISIAQSGLQDPPSDFETSVRLVALQDPFISYRRDLPVFAMTVSPQSVRLPDVYRAFARRYDIGAILNGHCQLEQSTAYKFFHVALLASRTWRVFSL